MTNLTSLYQNIQEDAHTREQIRKMIEVGKLERAKIAVMEFARDKDIYLVTDEAVAVLDMFRETDLTPDEQTQARFPADDENLGLGRDESIVDPAHRRLPPDVK